MKLKSLIIFLSLVIVGCNNTQVKEEKFVTAQEEREYLEKYGNTLTLLQW